MPKRGNLVDERLDGTSSCLFGNPKQVFVIFMGMNYSRHLLTVGQKEKKYIQIQGSASFGYS